MVLFWKFGLCVFLNRLLFICMFLVLGCFCFACAPLLFPMCLLVFASVFLFACAHLLLFLLVPPCVACVCFRFLFRPLDFAFAYACLFLLLLVSFCFAFGLGDRKMWGQGTKLQGHWVEGPRDPKGPGTKTHCDRQRPRGYKFDWEVKCVPSRPGGVKAGGVKVPPQR